MSYVTTDGDTTNLSETLPPVVNSDGSVEIYIITGTATFSLIQSGTNSDGSSSSFENINYSMNYGWTDILLASNNSGYVRTHSMTDIQTYQISTVDGASTFRWTDKHTTTDGIHETGLSPDNASDARTIDNYVTATSFSTDIGTSTADHLIRAAISFSNVGRDNYQDSDVIQTSTKTERDSLTGSDKWNNSYFGTATNNPDLTWTSAITYSGNTSGKDKFNDTDTTTSTTITPDALGATTLCDTSTLTDFGNDKYQFTNSGSLSGGSAGITAQTDTHNNTDSGNDDTSISDNGWVEWDGTEPDKSVVQSHDDFNDFVEDPSVYTDVDSGSSSHSASGSDTLTSVFRDNVAFDTSDKILITDTATNQYGTPAVATITDKSTDQGTEGDLDTLGDTETIAAGGADLLDAVNFDDKTNEQNSFNDAMSITVATNGQVGAGEFLNSTESLTLTDTPLSPSTDVIDDPGTENIPLTGVVAESDTFTETSTSDDQLQIGDNLESKDVTTLPDGTVITDNINNQDGDGITDNETDRTTDAFAESTSESGVIQAPTDDDHFNDQLDVTDNYTQNDNFSRTIVIPVPGGSITLGDSGNVTDQGTKVDAEGAVGEDNTANPSIDNETDTFSLTNSDQGTEGLQDSVNLNITDPNTGEVTQIQASDNLSDSFTEEDGEDETLGISTNPTPTLSETANAMESDTFNETSKMMVSVVGSPVLGVTIDFGDTVSGTDKGGGSVDDEESSGAVGSASATDKFSSNDNESENSSGHSQVKQNSTTDDGHGDTVSIDESDYISLSDTVSFGNQDAGQETFTEANGLETGDSEGDTDTANGEVDPSQTETTTIHDTTLSVDPITGLTTTTDYTQGGTDTLIKQDAFGGTDVHSASDTITNVTATGEDVTTSTSDQLSGTNNLTGTEQFNESASNSVHVVGNVTPTDSIDEFNLFALVDNSNDSFTNREALGTDGTDTDTSKFTGQFNIPTLYDLQVGKSSVTDPTTGITTTDMTLDVIDSKSSDSISNSDTEVIPATGTGTDNPVNSDSGLLQQAWLMVDTISQTDASGHPIGSVTTTSDTGSDTQTEVNGALNDPGATNVHVSSVAAAGSSPPTPPAIPNPGDLFGPSGPSGQGTPPPPDAPAGAAQQEVENLQLGVEGEKEKDAERLQTIRFVSPSEILTDQNGVLQIERVSADAKAAMSAALEAELKQQFANEDLGKQLFAELAKGMAEVDALMLPVPSSGLGGATLWESIVQSIPSDREVGRAVGNALWKTGEALVPPLLFTLSTLEIIGGGTLALGGGTVTAVSGFLSSPVSVPASMAGVLMVVDGADNAYIIINNFYTTNEPTAGLKGWVLSTIGITPQEAMFLLASTAVRFNTAPSALGAAPSQILSKGERLAEFNKRLTNAPAAKTADEAFKLLGKTLDDVEDAFSGVAKVENPGLKYQGRMYPPRADFTTKLPDGGLEAITAGNVIRISPNGTIQIYLKNADGTLGKLVFEKLGGG